MLIYVDSQEVHCTVRRKSVQMPKKAGKKIRMPRVNATKTMAENVFKSFFPRGFSKIFDFYNCGGETL